VIQPGADPPLLRPEPRSGSASGTRGLLGSRRRVLLAGIIVLVLLIGLSLALRPAATPAEPTVASTGATPAVAQYTAHGVVRPIAEARVGTQVGGTITQIVAQVGTEIGGGQEIARVRGPNGTEVITAPWSGTVADVLAHVGDTVVPGTAVATIDDLSRLQVETTDVDEFLIPHVRAGQAVTMTVDALDGRKLVGQVRTVGLEPRPTATGDSFYPVVIDLSASSADLHPGMSTQITFAP